MICYLKILSISYTQMSSMRKAATKQQKHKVPKQPPHQGEKMEA